MHRGLSIPLWFTKPHGPRILSRNHVYPVQRWVLFVGGVLAFERPAVDSNQQLEVVDLSDLSTGKGELVEEAMGVVSGFKQNATGLSSAGGGLEREEDWGLSIEMN
jgi:hypothetical protein